jgi:hypothetical protein
MSYGLRINYLHSLSRDNVAMTGIWSAVAVESNGLTLLHTLRQSMNDLHVPFIVYNPLSVLLNGLLSSSSIANDKWIAHFGVE